MYKIPVQPERLQIKIQYGAGAVPADNTHAIGICNSYCLSTTIMVSLTRLNIKLYVHCLVFLRIFQSQKILCILLGTLTVAQVIFQMVSCLQSFRQKCTKFSLMLVTCPNYLSLSFCIA
jgi:hypothetical protein